MGLETATFLSELNSLNPVASDGLREADDHMRLIKAVLQATFPGLSTVRHLERARVDLASSTTPDLSTPASNYINLTGTTTITGFAAEPDGFTRLLRFNEVLQLTHSASFDLPGSANITTAGNDHAIALSTGSGWRIIAYFRKSGQALVVPTTFTATQTFQNFNVYTSVAVPAAAAAGTSRIYSATRNSIIRMEERSVSGAFGVMYPPGGIIGWATATPPEGWLECDGTAISRTTFDRLFSILGTIYGAGNGSTTFNLPDFRGEFLRGWDHGRAVDPDRASRTDRGDGTTGDNVGTKQGHALDDHTHNTGLRSDCGGGTGNALNVVGSGTNTATSSAQGASVSTETRPRNVNIMYIIKY